MRAKYFSGIMALVFMQGGCNLFSGSIHADRGREYLKGLSAGWCPVTDRVKGDKGNGKHFITFSVGKGYDHACATEKEINRARMKYPNLAARADAVQDAFFSSELDAKVVAKKRAMKPENYWEVVLDTPPAPQPPTPYRKWSTTWNFAWNAAWHCYYRRYYRWYRHYGPHIDEDLERPVEKTGVLKANPASIEKIYDSGWLLYDPGEFKILPHNLKVPPEKIAVKMLFKVEGNRMVEPFGDFAMEKGAVWSNLTSSTIRIHRLYKDDRIDAIRIRVLAVK